MEALKSRLNLFSLDRGALPFIILFLTSFILPTASHRIVFYVLAFFLVKHSISSERRGDVFRSFCSYALIAYLSFFSMSSIWSEPFEWYGFFRTILDSVCIYIFAFSLAVYAPKIKLTSRFALTTALITLIASIGFAVFHYMFAQQFRLEGGGRYTNSIHFGIVMAMACILLASARFAGRGAIIQWGMIAFFTFLIFMTQARTALLALPLSLLVLSVFGHLRATIIFITMGFLTCAAAIYIWPEAFANIIGRADSYRLIIWEQAGQLVKDHVWLGIGILTEPNFSPVDWNPNGFKSTHNVFVGHFFTGGIIGLTFFGMLLFSAVRALICRLNMELKSDRGIEPLVKFVLSSLIFSSIAGCFVFTHYVVGVHIQWLVFWLPFALAWHLDAANKSSREQNFKSEHFQRS